MFIKTFIMKCTWDKLINRNEHDQYPRSYDDDVAYKIHKKIVNEFFTLEEYCHLLYIDPFEATTLVRNKFPYESNLEHYLLWIKPHYHVDVNYILKQSFNQFIAFKNIPTMRSIHTLSHYQVFVKL